MQVLEPPQTTSYSNNEGHFIKTFLISTKPNQAGWQINKQTAQDKVKSFLGKPFVIIPESLSSQKQKGHVFADTKDKLLLEYTKYTHGVIDKISEPIAYQDGTDDYFFTANIKLNDSRAASELIKHGEKSWIPFAVSPHIWPFKGNDDNIEDWEGVSLSLVPQGAYGQDAIVTKYCKGEEHACNTSLAAGLCDKEDSKAASTISSYLTQDENKGIMAQVTEQIPNQQAQPLTQIPKEEEKKQEGKSISNEEYEQLLKEKQEKEQLKTQLSQLINKDKTNTLNTIFKVVKDDTVKNQLVEKYFNHDTDILNEFNKDFTNHVLPTLIEEAKKADVKNIIDENKIKSKAASSLPKEPEIPKEEGSLVPNTVNQVLRLKQLMTGGF